MIHRHELLDVFFVHKMLKTKNYEAELMFFISLDPRALRRAKEVEVLVTALMYAYEE